MILNTATLVKDYDWIYYDDDALDSSGDSFFEEYKSALESNDISRLKLKPGQTPAIFKLRHVRGAAKKYLQDHVRRNSDDEHTLNPRSAYLAARLGLVGVENLVDEHGTELGIPTHKYKEAECMCPTETFMSMLNEVSGGDLVNMMGLQVIKAMYLSKN